MADANALASLYPQPVAPSQGNALMNDPAKALALVGQLNQNALFQQQFASRKAIGQAYQGAIQPDGSIDTPSLMRAIQQSPDAAFMAGEASAGALDRQGKQISNTTAQLEQDTKKNSFLVDALGSLADDPKLNADKVRNVAVTLARNLKLPGSMVNAWLYDLPKDQAGLRDRLTQMRNVAIGSAGTAVRVEGAPDASGAPQRTPLGAANYSGTTPVGLAPGEAALSESAGARAAKLQSSASTSPQYHADLENLRQESKVMGSVGGPTTETEKKINQIASRFGFSVSMTPDQLKSVESFDKIANQISLNQSTMFHGSDAGLHTVVGANASTSMSQYGREGVIDMLHGNQDAIDVMRKTWLQARANGAKPGDYDMFAERMGQEIDPRVFQFNRLSRDNQQKFLSQMEPEDLKEFEDKFKNAVSKKWVKPLKPAPAADATK